MMSPNEHSSSIAILKPEKNSTDRQAKKLKAVKEVFPLLAQMHQQKKDFEQLFHHHRDWKTGTFALIDSVKEAETQSSTPAHRSGGADRLET